MSILKGKRIHYVVEVIKEVPPRQDVSALESLNEMVSMCIADIVTALERICNWEWVRIRLARNKLRRTFKICESLQIHPAKSTFLTTLISTHCTSGKNLSSYFAEPKIIFQQNGKHGSCCGERSAVLNSTWILHPWGNFKSTMDVSQTVEPDSAIWYSTCSRLLQTFAFRPRIIKKIWCHHVAQS